MSTQIRAFLLLRSAAGEWQVEVIRDLESLVKTWKERSTGREMTGIVHIGFERSLARNFEDVAVQYPHRVLLTAAAKHALPRNFLASTTPIGKVENQSVYLALDGWGYKIEDVSQPISLPSTRPTSVFEDWLPSFLADCPDFSETLANLEIFDDSTYLEKESRLDPKTRKLIGLARYRILIREEDGIDPCSIARVAPPWLREREFSTMDVRVRIKNVFNEKKINTVSDLANYSIKDLLQMPNFGRTSISNLAESLNKALQFGPSDAVRQIESIVSIGLLQAIRRSLLTLNLRERDILSRRMGLNGSPETLAEIGDSYGITRERIRQIEAKTLFRLVANEMWDDILVEKLSRLLENREFPLPVLGIEAVDPWFSGVADNIEAFRYILSNVCVQVANLVEIDGIIYVAFLDQKTWDATVPEARRILESGTGKNWTEAHCRSLVDSLLPEKGSEFKKTLWDKSSRLCHFSSDDLNVNILRSYGRGAEQFVEAVLQESDKPLHYSEIFELVKLREKNDIDIRRVHNAAAEVGYLFDRGTYGLAKHFPLSSEEMAVLADQAESVISDSSSDRQWHATELFTTLIESGSSQALAVNKYILDAALCRSGEMMSLGRMVWAQPDSHGTEQARIDIRQAIISLVRQAGVPIKSRDIRQRLIALRGLNQEIQIQVSPPLIRVGPSLWGLIDRDLGLKGTEINEFTNLLVGTLERRGIGLHITELRDEIQFFSNVSIEAAFSIFSLDSRVRISVGQYVYLEKWGGPRRETIPVAVRIVLQNLKQPMSFSDIASLVQDRIGRRCDRPAISGCLQALGATLDDDGMWGSSLMSDDNLLSPA